MKRLRMLLIAAALMAGGSVLASAQPMDREGRGYGDGGRFQHRDRDDRRFRNRDDRRSFRDRNDYRFVDRDDYRFRDRDDRYFVGERRFFNGYSWYWDGHRWCRRDGRALIYFNF